MAAFVIFRPVGRAVTEARASRIKVRNMPLQVCQAPTRLIVHIRKRLVCTNLKHIYVSLQQHCI